MNQTTVSDLAHLVVDLSGCANAVVRFYSDTDGTRQVRVAIEDEANQVLVTSTRPIPADADDVASIASEAIQAALTEFAAQRRRAGMRAL